MWLQLFPIGLMQFLRGLTEGREEIEEPAETSSDRPTDDAEPRVSETEQRGSMDDAEPQIRLTTPEPAMKTCPMCAEDVRAAARICRFCRYEFPAS